MSVWSTPVTAGGGTRPTITVKPTTSADTGAVVMEYAGLSSATDAMAVDVMAHATATTGSAGSVSSGSTASTTGNNELSLGLYVDSGFGDTLTADAGYTPRANVAPDGDIELLAEDGAAAAGATPSASAGTGANTTWLIADIAFKTGASGPPTAPSAPTSVVAGAGKRQRERHSGPLLPTAARRSPATRSLTIHGSTAQAPTTVSGSPPSTSATITGLTNGTSYTFTVTATNAVGTGPASAASNAVTPAPSRAGQWSQVLNWPLVAVHAVLLNTGKYLVWDGWQQPQPTPVWDPSSQTFTSLNASDSIFCSGTVHLPDGRVLVVGGYGGLSTGQIGITDTSIFEPATSTWTRSRTCTIRAGTPT